VTKYKVKVLSGCESRRYGCEYDNEVGLLYPGEAAGNKGSGERVRDGEGDADNEAERLVVSVTDVASRESRSAPSGESHISCTPTDQPEANVGIAYAIVAIIL
jgi:hypothetical protein